MFVVCVGVCEDVGCWCVWNVIFRFLFYIMNIVNCKFLFGMLLDYFDVCVVVDVIVFGVYDMLLYMLCVFVENFVCCCDLVIFVDLLKQIIECKCECDFLWFLVCVVCYDIFGQMVFVDFVGLCDVIVDGGGDLVKVNLVVLV